MRILARRTLHHFVASRGGHKDQGALKAALDINPNHVDSLLLRVDKLINAEEYSATELTFYLGPYTYKQRLLLRMLRANSSFIRTGKPK